VFGLTVAFEMRSRHERYWIEWAPAADLLIRLPPLIETAMELPEDVDGAGDD
jgi:hypothetical protein